MKRIFILKVFLIAIILFELIFGIYLIFQEEIQKTSNTTSLDSVGVKKEKTLQIFYEKIPGSRFHGPDATWWGYNQSKIVRFKDKVFMYVMDNKDSDIKTLSELTLYKKEGNKAWEKGAKFLTSTPGNLLVDSKGGLHLFVITPKNVAINDTVGKLMYHYFPNARTGDITNYVNSTILENTDNPQTLNPRIGTTISPDDQLVLSFGMTKFNPLYKEQSEHIYYKNRGSSNWSHIYTDGLLHDYYYPFVVAANDVYHLLTVQDDFTGVGNPNIYQQILYFEFSNDKWSQELLVDLTSHTLANNRPRMVEQDDLFIDSNGTIHAIYKENTDSQNRFFTNHIHVSRDKNSKEWRREKLNLPTSINWVRLFEIDGVIYFFANSWNKHYIASLDSQNLVQLPINDAIGVYPYVAFPKTNSEFVDIILLAADSETFNKGTNVNYYLRIPKSEFKKVI